MRIHNPEEIHFTVFGVDPLHQERAGRRLSDPRRSPILVH